MFGCLVAHPSLAIFIPRHHSTELRPVFIFIVRLPHAPLSDRSSRPLILRKYSCEREEDGGSIAVASSPLISAQIKPPSAWRIFSADPRLSLYYISNQPNSVPYNYHPFSIPISQTTDFNFKSYVQGNPMLPGQPS